MEKKLLYLGYAVNDKEAELLSGASIAGNKMQLNLLKELSKKVNIEAVTIYPVASYPRDCHMYYKKDMRNLFHGLKYIRISFLNFPGIKQICQIIMTFLEISRFVRSNPKGIVLTYNMYPQLGIPVLLMKLFFKKKVFTLLADLPLDERRNRSFISKICKKIYDKLTVVCIRHIDYAIVLNEHVISEYKLNIPYIVMEGAVNASEINKQKRSSKEKNIVYTGALTEYSGILLAIQAFNKINNSNVKLDIYGSGELEGEIREYASNNENIRFYGKKDNNEILKIQKDAWILINPRVVDNPISKVTFPSKVLEYMLSGRPVMATRLNGFTKDYEEKIIWIEEENPDYLAKLIESLISQDEELDCIGEKAQEFITENKNWKIQCEYIWKFILENSKSGDTIL